MIFLGICDTNRTNAFHRIAAELLDHRTWSLHISPYFHLLLIRVIGAALRRSLGDSEFHCLDARFALLSRER
jgi:hypothetical protein